MIAAAIYFILVSWNINVSAWLASAGITGIAVGFAAKDTLANLFSGIFILADAPYKIGDFVNLDSGDRGEVTHVGLRSTRLLTRDDVEITVPNSVIANAKIINETGGRHEKERVRVKIGVAYGSDVDRLRDVILEIGNANPETCGDPEPRVRFRQFGDSSLDFELLCWIDGPVKRGRILDALNTEVYKALAREGIEIPYPKRDVYIKQMPGAN
jgi:MscS family membrane protein